MNFTLKRESYNSWGIVSTMTSDDNSESFTTLEHAYLQPDGTYKPKLNAGTHTCVLGDHNLEHSKGVQLYEITGVPNHSGILIHVGNYNDDSDGCVLIGSALGERSISGSKLALTKFMDLQAGQSFTLTVLE